MPLVSTPSQPLPPPAAAPPTLAPQARGQADAAVEAALQQAWHASAPAEAEQAAQREAKAVAAASPKKQQSLYLQPDESYDQAARLRSIMASYNAGMTGSAGAQGLAGSSGSSSSGSSAAGIKIVPATRGVAVGNVQSVLAPASRSQPTAVPQPKPSAGEAREPTANPAIAHQASNPLEVVGGASASLPEPLACNIPVIAITSGKGGVGKSSIAVNIASCLAHMQVRTTLIDADPGLANADLLCGVSPTTRLESVLATGAARRSMSTIAVQTPAGFALVPGSAGLARMADLGPADRVALLSAMTELEQSSDALLIDTGAGLSESVLAFVKHADFAIIIATPEPTSIADAYAMIKLLHAAKPPQPAGVRAAAGALPKRGGVLLVVNQAESQAEAMAVYNRITATSQRFLGVAPELLGWVPHDGGMRAAVRARTPITTLQPGNLASKQLQKLAQEIAQRAGLTRHALAPAVLHASGLVPLRSSSSSSTPGAPVAAQSGDKRAKLAAPDGSRSFFARVFGRA